MAPDARPTVMVTTARPPNGGTVKLEAPKGVPPWEVGIVEAACHANGTLLKNPLHFFLRPWATNADTMCSSCLDILSNCVGTGVAGF